MRLSEIGSVKGNNGIEEDTIALNLDADELFGDEFGYFLIVMLRGSTTGRKLKRVVFKFGCYQCICGFVLMCVTTYAKSQVEFTSFYMIQQRGMGATLFNLMWLTIFPALAMGFISALMIKYWASLCTNRFLLSTILKVYMMIYLFLFIFVLWCTCVLFLVFKPIDWRNISLTQTYFPTFFFSLLAILPYLFSIVYYVLDMSFYLEELVYPDVQIEEPCLPQYDCSDTSLASLCLTFFAIPLAYFLRCLDLGRSLYRAYQRFIVYRKRKKDEKSALTYQEAAAAAKGKKRKKGLFARLTKTTIRLLSSLSGNFLSWVKGSHKNTKVPVASPEDNHLLEIELLRIERNKEKEERLEYERKEVEAMRSRQQEQAEIVMRQRHEEDEKRQKQKEDELIDGPVLTQASFKALWGRSQSSGQFSTKLSSIPSVDAIASHMIKQGFHIVYTIDNNNSATQDTNSRRDMEVAVCNIRSIDANGDVATSSGWFMARFLISPTAFTAVMKSQDKDVTAHVKRFALAKVLKIA